MSCPPIGALPRVPFDGVLFLCRREEQQVRGLDAETARQGAGIFILTAERPHVAASSDQPGCKANPLRESG